MTPLPAPDPNARPGTKAWLYSVIFVAVMSVLGALALYWGIGSTPPGLRRPLTALDIKYVGCFAVPQEVGAYASGPACLRTKPDGTKTLLLTGAPVSNTAPGHDTAITEITIPTPAALWKDAPRAALVKSWGWSLYGGKRDAQNASDPTMPATYKPYNVQTTSMLCPAGSETLYYTYQDFYNPTGWGGAPCLGLSTFNADGTATCFGPFPFTAGSYLCAGNLMLGPPEFVTATGALSDLFGNAAQTSGQSSCCMGNGLVSLSKPTTSTPAYQTLPSKVLLNYPNANRQRRSPCYVVPGITPATPWGVDNQVDWAVRTLPDGNLTGFWGGGLNKNLAGCFVYTATAWGIFEAGCEGIGAEWYGHVDGTDNNNNPLMSLPDGTLAKNTASIPGTGPQAGGQLTIVNGKPVYDPTGPGFRARFWIQNPQDVLDLQAGKITDVSSIVPLELDPNAIAGHYLQQGADCSISGLAFDYDGQNTWTIYTVHPKADLSIPYTPLPAVHVWTISPK